MSADSDKTRVGRTARLERLTRLGASRTTRAHLSLSRRPDFGGRMHEGMDAALSALGEQLGCAVMVVPKVIDAAVVPESALGHSSGFALVELSAVGGMAVLEIELPFLACVLERMAGGGSGKVGPATALTRIEGARRLSCWHRR